MSDSKPTYPSDPAAWRRFAVQFSVLLAGVAAWLAWRGRIGPAAGWTMLAAAAAIAGTGLALPAALRRPYELSMRVSLWLGARVGPLVLGLCYFAIITPLGWLLRLGGYDPLGLKPAVGAGGRWRKAEPPGPLDRMF
jgi:hypothetical protein